MLFFLSAITLWAAEDKEVQQKKSGFWKNFADFFLPHAEKRKILMHKHTRYFMVTVEEDSKGLRHLVFNPSNGSQGVWNPKKPDEIISNYCKYMTLFLPMLDHQPERVLFIGMGIGVLPRFVGEHFPDAAMDIVEIDPDIPNIAAKYFAYSRTAGTSIIIKDGRDFINRNQHKYDLIIIDAYNSRNIPFQLTTREFYRKVRDALKPHGIVSVNVANLGKPHFVASEIKTIKSVFPRLEIYVCPDKSNYIPFAMIGQEIKQDFQKKQAEKIDSGLGLSYKMKDIIETRMKEAEIIKMTKDSIVLTDDYAPVATMK
jgi:spermidine synthase